MRAVINTARICLEYMKLKHFLLLFFFFSICSCRNEKNIEDEYYNSVVQAFSKNFLAEFGKYPTSHTWSTCVSKTISIVSSGQQINKVHLYSTDPTSSGDCFLMAETSNLTFTFDAPASQRDAYIVAELNDGKYIINKFDCRSSQISVSISSDDVVDAFELPTKPMEFFIAYDGIGYIEDLDYNDVVLSVTHVAGQENARFAVYAAGCTGNVDVLYQNGSSQRYIFREVHSTLGELTSNGMVNTLSNNQKIARTDMTNRAVTNTFSVGEDISVNDIALKIIVKKDDLSISYKGNTEGNKFAPMAIIIGNPNWEWPSERTKISYAYPDFANYVFNENNYPDWCK